jgi:PAS domain S-box-containing protein
MNDNNQNRNNRILVIDDNPAIHEDIKKILCSRARLDPEMAESKALLFGESSAPSVETGFELDSAFQGEEGLEMVRRANSVGRPYALAFVDVRMPPGWDGVETINRIWKNHPDLQVVICTAYSDYSWEEMVGQIGKTDNMVVLKKPFDNIEVLQLAHAMTEKWSLNREVKGRLNRLDQLVTQRTSELQTTNDQLKVANDRLKEEIAERMQVEKALRLSEERFSKAFKASPIPLAIQSLREEKFVDANSGFLALAGYAREELIGHQPEELNLWSGFEDNSAVLRQLHSQMSIRSLPCKLRTKAGQVRETLLSAELFQLEDEPYILTIAQDITEQLKLERELRQAQKMEAVGQLAAGVAHDFNNILTVVQGHASILRAGKPPESGDCKSLDVILAASQRASKLVRQLLTFSRRHILQARPMGIGEVLSPLADMLPRVLGENITVKVIVPRTPPAINADAGLLEQILMNLSVNARDAMPHGGQLTILAEAVEVLPETARISPEARPGRFLVVSVIDTGTGIAPEVLPRIFEPFFTTKPIGQGTGLGLATVYGIVKQHEGWVEVQSQVGKGTTFRVFLPACKTAASESAAAAESQPAKGGNERILVVEDEDQVRDYVVQLLKSAGYTVLSAPTGAAALDEFGPRAQDIDLVITDMVMPGNVSGRELAGRLLVEKPSLKVIYTSGYSPGMAGKDLALLEGRNFLAKPYTPDMLLHLVRHALDQKLLNS